MYQVQTFSSMRRNSIDQNYIGLLSFAVLLYAAQTLSSLYTFIPSLAGFLFCYLILFFKNDAHKLPVFMTFVYLSLYDINKGFYLFSYLILFFLFYRFSVENIEQKTSCQNCVLALYVCVGYIGHFLINACLAYFFNTPFPYFTNHYFYLIGIDALLAFVFLRTLR